MPKSDFQQANRGLVAKDYQEAIRLYVRHADAHPEDAARSFTKAGEAAKRAGGTVHVMDIAPGLQRLIVSHGDLRGAEALFRRALEVDPNYVPALRELALILPDDASERRGLLERAAAVRDDLMALNSLGDLYVAQRQYELAYQAYLRAQRHRPNGLRRAARRLSSAGASGRGRRVDQDLEAGQRIAPAGGRATPGPHDEVYPLTPATRTQRAGRVHGRVSTSSGARSHLRAEAMVEPPSTASTRQRSPEGAR